MKIQLTHFFLAIEDYMLPCLTKRIFGVDCPGCGMQRSLLALFSGDFVTAFKMYPAIYAIVPLFIFLSLSSFSNLKISNKIIVFFTAASIVMILGNYILKFI
ncbi:DUF2752 domain-containing protein [Euzebyella marina]|nr:DUF2752 domain-containing protein [Euzebyella marina]